MCSSKKYEFDDVNKIVKKTKMESHAEIKKKFLDNVINHMNTELKKNNLRHYDEDDIASIIKYIDNDVDKAVIAYMESNEMNKDWFSFDTDGLIFSVNGKKIILFKGYSNEDFVIIKDLFHKQIRCDLTIGISDMCDEYIKPYSESQIQDVFKRFEIHISDTVDLYLSGSGSLTPENDLIREWCIVDVESSPMKLILDGQEYNI